MTSDFDFELPAELIAQHPSARRDESRLMVVDRGTGGWTHARFSDLPGFLRRGDVLARNNTAVVPARLRGVRTGTGGRWEGLFLREREGGGDWELLCKTRGSLRAGERVRTESGLELELTGRGEGGEGVWLARPMAEGGAFELLGRHGELPLPPYIRGGREGEGDRERYQTTYASRPGSVAAPTAGLHFTGEVFERLSERGVDVVELTLHVGIGTFRPITAERVEDHQLHSEWAELGEEAAGRLRRARAEGGRVVAVGTTSARVLEYAARAGGGEPRGFRGECGLYIKPGHEFLGIQGLITNFHLPRSSLIVLVSALLGREATLAAYAEAIREGYRFYSYGDAMLIL